MTLLAEGRFHIWILLVLILVSSFLRRGRIINYIYINTRISKMVLVYGISRYCNISIHDLHIRIILYAAHMAALLEERRPLSPFAAEKGT